MNSGNSSKFSILPYASIGNNKYLWLRRVNWLALSLIKPSVVLMALFLSWFSKPVVILQQRVNFFSGSVSFR
jgi:hypothetical protein